MKYYFDLTRLSIQDYADLLGSVPSDVIRIAGKCSLIDINTVPITEIAPFIDSFTAAFVEYISIQYPEGK